MDGFSDWLQWILAAPIAIVGWIMKRLHAAVDDLQKDVDSLERRHEAHRLHIAENYVNKPEMASFQAEMRSWFGKLENAIDRICDKLDSKADKK